MMTVVNPAITIKSTTDSNTQSLPIHIYLGGSFDPVHNGHLSMLQHVMQSLASHPPLHPDIASLKINAEISSTLNDLNSSKVQSDTADQQSISAYMMPTSRSPLKQNISSPEHRLHMLMLAIADVQSQNQNYQHNIAISNAEIWQTPPTYSINTLRILRAQNPSASLIFVLGADNIANLSKWRDGDKLTEFVHLWVIPRDQLQHRQHIINLLPQVLRAQVTNNINDLKTQHKGSIYIDSMSVAPISSTTIRQQLNNGKYSVAKTALPASVYSYIIKNNLYKTNAH